MKDKTTKQLGRRPKPEAERVKILQLYAKVKHHDTIMAKFKAAIERFEKKLDKQSESV